MKNIIINTLAAILFLSITSVASAESLTDYKGKVVDKETSEPVPYANIAIYDICTDELVNGDLSNEEGEFELEEVDGDNYYVVVSHLAYKSEKIDYEDFVSGKDDITIEVDEKEIALEEIVIRGDRIIVADGSDVKTEESNEKVINE
jgi:hypothetical protein